MPDVSIDIFSTYTMLEMMALRIIPREFIRRTFWWRENHLATTKQFLVDIEKWGRGVATFVHPRREGKLVEAGLYETYLLEAPYIKEKTLTTAGEVMKRAAGEVVWSRQPMSPIEKAARKLGQDLAKLDDRFVRREELMCCEVIFYGQATAVGDGIDAVYDYRMEASHKIPLNGSDAWSDVDNSDPMNDIWEAQQLILRDGGTSPTHCIMGIEAAKNFLRNKKVIEQLDTRRIVLGQIDPVQLPSGATYLGRHNLAGVDIYCYNEWYTDESGTPTAMVPPKRVSIGSPNALLEFYYGPIEDYEAIEGGVFAVERYPDSWVQKEKGRWLSLQSAPLPAMNEPNSFVIIITQPEE